MKKTITIIHLPNIKIIINYTEKDVKFKTNGEWATISHKDMMKIIRQMNTEECE